MTKHELARHVAAQYIRTRYGQEHKPGDVWRTDSGKWRAMNPDGDASSFNDEDAAKAYAKGEGGSGGEEDSALQKGAKMLKGLFNNTKKSLKDWGAAKQKNAKIFLQEAPEQAQKFMTDPEARKEMSKKSLEVLKKVPGTVANKLKDAALEDLASKKQAAVGAKKLISGEKLSDDEKGALKSLVLDMAMVGIVTAGTGGMGALAKAPVSTMIKGFAKKFGQNYASEMVEGIVMNAIHPLAATYDELNDYADVLSVLGKGAKLVLSAEADGEDTSEDEKAAEFVGAMATAQIEHALANPMDAEDMVELLGQLAEEAGEETEEEQEEQEQKEAFLREALTLAVCERDLTRMAKQHPRLEASLMPVLSALERL